MFTAGIIAEYNPFHNGHKYQIEQTRKMGATHIVIVMSGDSVQRGETAIFSKYERAKSALSNGADLVIELPCPYSCSNGEVFAKSAVSLLAGLGENVVNGLSFGSESGDTEMLTKAAQFSAGLNNSEILKNFLSQGMTYPQAVHSTAKELLDENQSKLFSSPNNVLGIEYIKAINQFAGWIKPMPIKRMAVEHDSQDKSDGFASATEIRRMIRKGEDYSEFVPYKFSGKCSIPETLDKAVLLKIMTASKNDVLSLPDSNEDIANRFLWAVNSSPKSVEAFMQSLKTKNITMARIRRLILHLILGVKSEDIVPVPYGRIIGLNNRGREILAKSVNRKIPYGTSLKKLEDTSDFAKRISFLEQNAVRFREMCSNEPFSNEYKKKITIT